MTSKIAPLYTRAGRRLALAARAVAYGEGGVPFTGPLLAGCTVHAANRLCPPGLPASACQSALEDITQVSKTPSWPRSWANFSLF